MSKFIVAEVSKNWHTSAQASNLISQQFESVINVNAERGYTLTDWKIVRTYLQEGWLNETIIAIFEKVEE